MKELELKYGCNPNQKPSRIYMEDGSELPFSYKYGKLSMENDGAYMTFARAVLDESALNLADLIGAVG